MARVIRHFGHVRLPMALLSAFRFADPLKARRVWFPARSANGNFRQSPVWGPCRLTHSPNHMHPRWVPDGAHWQSSVMVDVAWRGVGLEGSPGSGSLRTCGCEPRVIGCRGQATPASPASGAALRLVGYSLGGFSRRISLGYVLNKRMRTTSWSHVAISSRIPAD